ncbi:MAG: DUF1679 domain-containing protein [Myxococcales bacterium]|nr:MAG: DUF1679 domain-containing protein [Myxococcales bacterium]
MPTEQITPQRLTAALSEAHAGVEVRDVRVVETSVHGSERVSTADRIVLEIDFAPGADAGLPARMLLKTFLDRPHAPRVMYRTEARFYRQIRPELSVETPLAYGTLVDESDGRHGVLLEDLSLRQARFIDATTEVSLDEIRALLRNLARLHAQYWETPRFDADLSWVATPLSGGMHDTFRSIGLELVRDQLEIEYKARLVEPLGRTLDELWSYLWKAQEILASPPSTLLHGDTHIGNTYLLPDGRAGLIDWQLMVRGAWAHDVTYLLVTGLTTQCRRAHQGALLGEYLEELRGGGVDPPAAEEAWVLYRQAAIWGLVLGWLITPPGNYGEAVTSTNIARLVAAVEDLQTFAALT